jgi:hypothetical protein
MTDDVVDDPTRIAQLLASELTGLETGRLAAVSVTAADRDAEPTPAGTTAYTVAYDGDPIGDVVLYPETAVLEVADDYGAEPSRIPVETGAATKGVVDRVRELLAAVDEDSG